MFATTLQYLGGRSLGVCFAQVKAGVISHWDSKGVQAPATRRIFSVRTGRADAGRHWSQRVDGQGSGLAISAFDQQTEQAQFSGCSRRMIHSPPHSLMMRKCSRASCWAITDTSGSSATTSATTRSIKRWHSRREPPRKQRCQRF